MRNGSLIRFGLAHDLFTPKALEWARSEDASRTAVRTYLEHTLAVRRGHPPIAAPGGIATGIDEDIEDNPIAEIAQRVGVTTAAITHALTERRAARRAGG